MTGILTRLRWKSPVHLSPGYSLPGVNLARLGISVTNETREIASLIGVTLRV